MRYIYLLLAIIMILALSVMSLNCWQAQYPLLLEFHDIGYHVNSAVGLQRSGGFTLTNFWAGCSQDGTPNVYFPFFHIVSLLLLSVGVSKFFLTYWVSWMLFPLSFITFLVFAYKVYGARVALYAASLLALFPIWMEKQWGLPPQALVYILTPLVFLAVAKRKFIIAMILSVLCMATHFTGVGLIGFLFLYGLFNKEARKPVFIMLGVLLVLGSPFLFLILKRARDIQFPVAFLGGSLWSAVTGALRHMFSIKHEFHVYLGWLAAIGIVVCFFRKKKYLILPAYFLAYFPMAWTSVERRFWLIPCFFIFSLLGGVALGAMHERIEKNCAKPGLARLNGVVFFIVVFLMMNLGFYYGSDRAVQVKTPTLMYLSNSSIWPTTRLTFSMKDREYIAGLVEKNVKEDEFFWVDSSNNINNFIGLNTERSTVRTINDEKNSMTLVEGIKLVVAREIPSQGYAFLDKVNDEYNAYILEDASKAAKVNITKPLVKTETLKLGFLGLGFLMIILLLRSPRPSLLTNSRPGLGVCQMQRSLS